MSKIDRITLRGFKSIRELVDFPLRNLNVIVGANGAGKSNFIQLFHLVRNMLLKNLQEYTIQHGGASSFLFNGLKMTRQIQAEFKFGENSYRFFLVPTADDKFAVSESRRYRDFNWHSFSSSASESRLEDDKNDKSLTFEGYNGPGHYVHAAISRWMIYHFHDTSDHAPMRGFSIVEDNEYLREDAANVASFLRRLKYGSDDEKRSYMKIVEAIRLVMPFFDDFLLEPVKSGPADRLRLSWRQKGSDYPFQPYHLSDGSIRFICLATALLQPDPPSTIIIDEPELGLHPQAVGIVAELMKVASSATQVIAATQSPQLLDSFEIEDIVVARRRDGSTVFERLAPADYSEWIGDFAPGALWANNVIEGGPIHE